MSSYNKVECLLFLTNYFLDDMHHEVASWTWNAQDETRGICRMAFHGCCLDC
ncbi:unnamed protein product [Brassica rapa subsp. trilocularis]